MLSKKTDEVRIDLAICGEGPGEYERIKGRPFCGPSGKILRDSLRESGFREMGLSVLLVNLVACRPWVTSPGGIGNREPDQTEIDACRPRLEATLKAFKPIMVVGAGHVSTNELETYNKSIVKNFMRIPHPAYISRNMKLKPEYVIALSEVLEATLAEKLARESEDEVRKKDPYLPFPDEPG